MNTLSWLFGKNAWSFGRYNEKEQNQPSGLNRKDGISYHPELIQKLKNDHQHLVNILMEVKTIATSQKFAKIPQLLTEFKSLFQTHLIDENIKFYVYVQQNLKLDEQTTEFIKDIRSEMNGIARAVVHFADAHIAVAPNSASAGKFLAELEGIGEVLLKRVHIEETRLYTLYSPA